MSTPDGEKGAKNSNAQSDVGTKGETSQRSETTNQSTDFRVLLLVKPLKVDGSLNCFYARTPS